MLRINSNPYWNCIVVYIGGLFINLYKSKLSLFVTIVVVTYFVNAWTTLTYKCETCPSSKVSEYNFNSKTKGDNLNWSQTSATLSTNILELQNISEKYSTSGPIFNYNLRNQGAASSNEELDFLLNIRKLILFTVHELNRSLKNTGCVQFWANPLDLSFYKEISKSVTHIYHKIRFIIQPGNVIYLQVEIRQKLPPLNLNDTDLEIASNFEFSNTPSIMGPCTNNTMLSGAKRKTCICSNRKEVEHLQHTTDIAMKLSNSMDPELETWKPGHSFMVEDYLNFTNYQEFVRSPGNTKNDIRDLNYSSEYCSPKLKMLVMISSAPTHFKQRKAIRNTFGSAEYLNGKGIKVVFLMGISTDENVKLDVLNEEAVHEDIIVANFYDSYHNLSLSHISMYKWIQLTCGNGQSINVSPPKFILKADDDFVLNLDLAVEVAEANHDVELIGGLLCDTNVVRQNSNESLYFKYYTPRYMHISGTYAGYFNGVAYLLRSDIIPHLLHASMSTPFIHMDDAYVTGILPKQLKIYPRNSKMFTWVRIKPDACNSKTVVNSHVNSPEDMIEQWSYLMKPIPSNCTLVGLPLKVERLLEVNKRKCFYE